MARHVGMLLRDSRKKRGLSLRGLAQQAGIGKSTLARWEAGSAVPNLPELEAVLAALRIPEAGCQQALAMVDAPRVVERLTELMGERPPLNGDLLRAMRHRHNWTQAKVAAQIGVTQGMLAKWERSEDWPSTERLHQLCYTLEAHDEELTTLLSGRFVPDTTETAPIGWEDIFALSSELLYPSPADAPLRDLRFLALESRLWHLSSSHSPARFFLTRTYALHARMLHDTGRLTEARSYAERTLSLVRAGTPALVELKDPVWLDAVIILARLIGKAGSHSSATRAVALLNHWLPEALREEYRAWMLSDMALLLARAGEPESAISLSTKAHRHAMNGRWKDEISFRECDHAHVLLISGRPRQALSYLSRRIGSFEAASAKVSGLLIASEALLALGKTSEAQDCLQTAMSRTDASTLAVYRVQAEALLSRLTF